MIRFDEQSVIMSQMWTVVLQAVRVVHTMLLFMLGYALQRIVNRWFNSCLETYYCSGYYHSEQLFVYVLVNLMIKGFQ